MSHTAPDFTDDVVRKLQAAGYAVYARKGDSEDTCPLEEGQIFWFTWATDRTDIEVGEGHATELSAWADALDHLIENWPFELPTAADPVSVSPA